MTKKLIYVVEDEKHIRELISFNLGQNGYEVKAVEDANRLVEAIAERKPDLFILDLMLPGIDGIEITRRIKQDNDLKRIPIIMLTAKSEEFDKVLGLEMGADDYITKPFSVREFIARVKVIFRRKEEAADGDESVIETGVIRMEPAKHAVYKDGQPIELTLKEFDLLRILMLNKGMVLSRERLLDEIWGYDFFGETRTVDVHVRYLRQKIEDDDKSPELIETVRGVGYRFNAKGGK